MSCCFTVEQFTLHMQICSTKKKLSLRVAKPLTNETQTARVWVFRLDMA